MRSSAAGLPTPSTGPVRRTRVLAAVFAVAGLGHFVRPRLFEAIVPNWVPRPRAMVYLSGVAELACSTGLALDAGWAGPASAALLLAVWPANVQMAVDETRAHRSKLRQVVLWGRLPMQLPMIKTALDARKV